MLLDEYHQKLAEGKTPKQAFKEVHDANAKEIAASILEKNDLVRRSRDSGDIR